MPPKRSTNLSPTPPVPRARRQTSAAPPPSDSESNESSATRGSGRDTSISRSRPASAARRNGQRGVDQVASEPCDRSQQWFFTLSDAATTLAADPRSGACRKCGHCVHDHRDEPASVPPAAIETSAGSQPVQTLATSSVTAVPLGQSTAMTVLVQSPNEHADATGPLLGFVVRAVWGGDAVVPVTEGNPLTQDLFRTLRVRMTGARESRDWETVFRKTVSPMAVPITRALKLVAPPTASLTSIRFAVDAASAPIGLEDLVDFLCDLGVALLHRHHAQVKDEAARRRLHREYMVAGPRPVTAREDVVERVIQADSPAGTASLLPALRLPESYQYPAFWGALWLVIAPPMRLEYWTEVAKVLFAVAVHQRTRNGMGLYLARGDWEARFAASGDSAAAPLGGGSGRGRSRRGRRGAAAHDAAWDGSRPQRAFATKTEQTLDPHNSGRGRGSFRGGNGVGSGGRASSGRRGPHGGGGRASGRWNGSTGPKPAGGTN